MRVPYTPPMMTANLLSFSLIIFSLTLLFVTILYSEKLHNIDRGRMDNESIDKTIYRRIRTHKWYQVISRKTNGRKLKVGRVRVGNISFGEIDNEIYGRNGVEMVDVDFEDVSKNVTWSNLFPEWIDESLPSDSSKCPYIPMPNFERYVDLDVVVADVPCGEAGRTGGRNFEDVLRLHLNLVVANLLVKSGRKDGNVVAVFIGSCGPMSEIFRCDDLWWREGNSWIYRPDLERLKEKVIMPVGSCQLAPPLHIPSQQDTRAKAKEAYVTVLHSSEDYVCGALVLAQSIIKSNSTRDLVLLADDSISVKSLQGLRAAGWKITHMQRIRNPNAETETYNEWNYSKLRIWELIEYDKLIFIDTDFVILRNTDEFFDYPQLSAVGNNKHLFNSGFMLVEPSTCMFRNLMKQRFRVSSYNGGDQGFLNEMVTWWHRWPAKLNFLKFFDPFNADYRHEVIPKDVYALHYLGVKPWMCHEDDHDCNWEIPENKRFASDSAHRIWWRFFNDMPNELRGHCVFTQEMEDRIKLHIAKAAN
ncbi:hypothetical protein OROGR_024516 [Orobanche gracilis]